MRTEQMLWSSGTWTAPPVAASEDGGDLLVTAVEGSDAWRHTAYGFVHDDAHALLAPLEHPGAVEVTFDAGYDQQFDQAGLMIRADAETWVKTGVEFSDGVPQLGAVVTVGRSDWSVAPVPDWAGRRRGGARGGGRGGGGPGPAGRATPSRSGPGGTRSRIAWCGSARSRPRSPR